MAILKVADYYNCGVLERQTGNVAIYPVAEFLPEAPSK